MENLFTSYFYAFTFKFRINLLYRFPVKYFSEKSRFFSLSGFLIRRHFFLYRFSFRFLFRKFLFFLNFNLETRGFEILIFSQNDGYVAHFFLYRGCHATRARQEALKHRTAIDCNCLNIKVCRVKFFVILKVLNRGAQKFSQRHGGAIS